MRLSEPSRFRIVAEVSPPRQPNTQQHQELASIWTNVLVTDRPMSSVRVSAYAYGARITHDVPALEPTIVVSPSGRDAGVVESEVLGAHWNGVRSFLIVNGGTWFARDIFDMLVDLRRSEGLEYEIGRTTFHDRQSIQRGADFYVTSLVVDEHGFEEVRTTLNLEAGDAPVYLGVSPPFSRSWVERMVKDAGAQQPHLHGLWRLEGAERRAEAWRITNRIVNAAKTDGFAGVILMGLKHETLMTEVLDGLALR